MAPARRVARRAAAPELGDPRRLRAPRRARPASPPPTTSTAATTKAWATSRSTSAAACAGTRARPSCARRRAAPTSRSSTDALVTRVLLEGAPGQRARGHRAAAGRRRCTAAGARGTRGGAGRRRGGHAADAAAVGHRRRCAAARARHRAAPRTAGRRREPAGPPADPRRLRGGGREDAEHDRQLAVGQGHDRPRIPAAAERADEHGAVAAGRLHALVAGSRLAERGVPRAAAVAGRLRRAAAPLQRLHRQRVQPEPGLARLRAHRLAAARGRAAHPGATTCPRPKTARWRPIRCA